MGQDFSLRHRAFKTTLSCDVTGFSSYMFPIFIVSLQMSEVISMIERLTCLVKRQISTKRSVGNTVTE